MISAPLNKVCAYVCGAAGLVATSLFLCHNGFDLRDQLRFGAAEALTVFLPGYTLARLLRLTNLSLLVGMSFVLGLGPQLAGWALAVTWGSSFWLYAIPLLVAAISLLVGRMRLAKPLSSEPNPREANCDKRGRHQVPWWVSTSLLLVWMVLLVLMQQDMWRRTPISGSRRWYQDLYWHLSITADALHHVPPTDPQSAPEGNLSYHWFSNAHTAALTMASGVDIVKTTVIAWYVPVVLATLALTFWMAFSRVLASSPRHHYAAYAAGVLAAVLLIAPAAFVVRGPLDPHAESALIWFSPSHIFGLPVTLALTWLAIEGLARRKFDRTLWALAAYVALLCPGAKVSILPAVLGGVAVAGLISLRMARRWQAALRHLIVGVCGVAIVVITAPLFAGGGGGSRPAMAATADQSPLWNALDPVRSPRPFLLFAVELAMAGAFACAGFALNLRTRQEPGKAGAGFFAGEILVGVLAMFLLKHPSLSQLYFLRGLAPVIAAFTAAGFVVLIARFAPSGGSRRLSIAMATATAILSGAVAIAWSKTSIFGHVSRVHPWGVVGAAVITMVALVIILRCGALSATPAKKLPVSRARAYLMAVSCILSFAVAPALADDSHEIMNIPRPMWPEGTPALTSDELTGAKVLARLNTDGSVVATNVHCLDIVTRNVCDARGFWVSAFTQSPVFIGGWGYSASARAADGKHGLGYFFQPYAAQQLFRLNEAVFAKPQKGNVAELRAHGVRYLYADSRASRVSPALANFAERVWGSPSVTVYRLN